jgi:predicted DsbA family dithiol-disulfide isomerase
MTTDPSISAYEALARAKGISLEESMEMHAGVVSRARQVGLDYRFDIAIPANTFLAHQFLHEAREQGRQDQANELIMKAYFTEGKNVDDTSTLIRIGQEAGMDPKLTADALKSGTHAGAVENDIYEASRIGVQGVPFFLFDDKYTVRGAQDPSVFLTTLEKSYKEWKSRNEK